MHCSNCGAHSAGSERFCIECGRVFEINEGPTYLGHYRLVGKIGDGGMGVVYHAVDEEQKREVALKVLHGDFIKDKSALTRFRREAYLQSKLDHPNTVKLLAVYEDGRNLGLIMELLHGCELKAYLRKHGALSGGQIHWLANEILCGLESAHGHGIVHRDIKTSNIFLTHEGGVKIMDFGTAKLQTVRSDLTNAGSTVGSYHYMAPEQIGDGEIDARTDLYAFGVVLYQLATGTLPFTGKVGGVFEIMQKQLRHRPKLPELVNPDVSGELSTVIMKLLEKEPDQRYASCASVLQALSALGEMIPLSLRE